jgi:hypothetical protein
MSRYIFSARNITRSQTAKIDINCQSGPEFSDLASAACGCTVANFMKYGITFALVLVLPLAVQAAPFKQVASPAPAASPAQANPNPPSEQSVNEMITLMQLEGLLSRALQQMNEGMNKGMEASMAKATSGRELTPAQKASVEDFRKKYSATMSEELSLAKIKNIYVQAFRDSFSQEEVNGVIAFYKSPAGKAIIERNPVVMQKAAALTEARIGPLTQKLDGMQGEFFKQFTAPK